MAGITTIQKDKNAITKDFNFWINDAYLLTCYTSGFSKLTCLKLSNY